MRWSVGLPGAPAIVLEMPSAVLWAGRLCQLSHAIRETLKSGDASEGPRHSLETQGGNVLTVRVPGPGRSKSRDPPGAGHLNCRARAAPFLASRERQSSPLTASVAS